VTSKQSSQELLQKICELIYEHDPVGLSAAIVLSDIGGIQTTIRVGKELDKEIPGHMERALLILNAMYYRKHIGGDEEPQRYVIKAGKDKGTVQ
jgi:hypothetical protein